jgi:2-polyprenyl-3-methyl-5-hydroxy-6-metoxy-1,4-benzoquinol methylase
MFNKSEINDELKLKVKDWWNQNPFIYDKHKGAAKNEETGMDLEFFKKVDEKIIKWMSPWAHSRFPLLSNLINYDSLKDKKVLDIGVGSGWTTEQFCRAGADVTAIDITPKAVELTKNG